MDGFWKGKKVLITGNTGFKGAWLSLWLGKLGAEIKGYALRPPTNPSMFELCGMEASYSTDFQDVRAWEKLSASITAFEPEIVFHMAAQPLVMDSYRMPAETFETNIMGTVNLLEAVRRYGNAKAVVVVTSDKCYENAEKKVGYREGDPLGGDDPYSASKAGAEIVAGSYIKSFFSPEKYQFHSTAVATARAGNVIGGGDWANYRLLPDCIRALLNGEKILIRNPGAIRPWQHVLEPLSGYMTLAKKLYEKGPEFSGAWNFGPDDSGVKTVEWVVGKMCEKWGADSCFMTSGGHVKETAVLKLDSSKSKKLLGWKPKWEVEEALEKTVDWVRAYSKGADVCAFTLAQIEEYSG